MLCYKRIMFLYILHIALFFGCLCAAVPLTERQWLTYGPIDSSATAEAKALLRYIQSQYGWHYLSGQQERTEVQWLKSNIGKTPAIQGSDLMDYSPSRVAYGTTSTAVEDAIAFDRQGGIVTITWHWNAPNCLYNSAAQPWYSGFYTSATCFNIQTALAQGSNGAEYKLLLRDVDAIAAQLKRLRDANVPILFRPLHEPDGAWFWWGAKGAGPYKQLWDLLYDRVTRYHGLHNMLWVCNTEKSDWYPGNSKCDIATTDVYVNAGDHSVQKSHWDALYGVTGGQRVLALGEVGVIPDPERQASENVPWAYWMTWNGNFIRDGNYNSKTFLQSTFSNSRVVTLDGPSPLGNWKSG